VLFLASLVSLVPGPLLGSSLAAGSWGGSVRWLWRYFFPAPHFPVGAPAFACVARSTPTGRLQA